MEDIIVESAEDSSVQKLKPVVFNGAVEKEHRPNVLQQQLLFQAMQETQSPEKLKEMIGAKNVAEVYRVFDIMVNQKEFQKSLRENNITFDRLSKRLSYLIEFARKESDSLKAMQMVMQSMGIDKFVPDQAGTANWQDLLLKTAAKNGEPIEGELAEEEAGPEIEMYEVNRPELPESLKRQDAEEGSHGQNTTDAIDDVLKKIYE